MAYSILSLRIRVNIVYIAIGVKSTELGFAYTVIYSSSIYRLAVQVTRREL